MGRTSNWGKSFLFFNQSLVAGVSSFFISNNLL
jgi:hypothetical protein